MRINKYLALKANFSRREADRAIKDGRIKIGGRIAKLGDQVIRERVSIDDKFLVVKKYVYLAFNKPSGIITSGAHWDQKAIKNILKFSIPVHPVGRLDKDSTGLILLTNDTRVTDALLGPETNNQKEYIVSVNRPVTDKFLDAMKAGVDISVIARSGATRQSKTKKTIASKVGVKKFKIILTEGKNRQVRKMCETLDYRVQKLERVRILNIRLKDLQPGEHRVLGGVELARFLKEIGLEKK